MGLDNFQWYNDYEFINVGWVGILLTVNIWLGNIVPREKFCLFCVFLEHVAFGFCETSSF